jgi:putative transposase
MPRPPRLQIAGATYHVMNRGNRKAVIFDDDRDCRRFLRILLETREVCEVDVLAGCLMRNHFHLLVTTPHPNISEFMQRLEGRFAQYSNRRHGRVGHVFGGPFKGVIVENDIHLLTAACYVFGNPIAAGLVTHLEDWKWSTFAATAGFAARPAYLSIGWIEELFPAASLEDSQRQLRELLNEAKPVDAYLMSNEPVFGSEAFKKAIRSYIGDRLSQAAMPRAYRALCRPTLEEIFRSPTRDDRAILMQRAHVVYGYRLAEIARSLALHPGTVSKIVCSLRRRKPDRK